MFETWDDLNHIALSSNSVTALLKADSGHDVIAEVIQEGWKRPSHREVMLLSRYGIKSQRSWVREVILTTNGQTRAIARILVIASEIAEVPWIQRLGTKPLGATLFSDYAPVREHSVRDYARFSAAGRRFSLKGQQLALSKGFKLQESYWIRSSVLNIENRVHCLVTECFL